MTREDKKRRGSQISTDKDTDAPPIAGPDIFYPRLEEPWNDQTRSVTNVSWMGSLRFYPIEDVMVFATASSGFKSGGFNQLRVSVAELDPEEIAAGLVQDRSEFDDETSFNYEVGIKSTFFDRRVTANATGFYTDYHDFQAQTFNGAQIALINAGRFESYGIETDFMLIPFEGMVSGLAIAWNHTEFREFDKANCTAEQTGWGLGRGLLLLDPCVQDLKGRRLANAPRWTVSAWSEYENRFPWFSSNWFIRGSYSFQSEIYLDQDLDENLKQDGRHLLSFRAGLRSEEQTWLVEMWIRNVLDERYQVIGFDVPTLSGFGGITAPPRQFGARLRYAF